MTKLKNLDILSSKFENNIPAHLKNTDQFFLIFNKTTKFIQYTLLILYRLCIQLLKRVTFYHSGDHVNEWADYMLHCHSIKTIDYFHSLATFENKRKPVYM